MGVQCVDCVAHAANAMPSTRTVFGGRVRQGRPVATLTFMGLCIASYVVQMVDPTWLDRWAFHPVFAHEQPYRFLTAAFLHGSILHLASNMIALWFVGPYLEQALGRTRFVALYLVSAFAGQVAVLVFAAATGGWDTWVVGASGAVFGLFGAIFFVQRRLGLDAAGIVGLIAINVVIGFTVPNIAWQAHAGGLVVGALMGAVYSFAPQRWRRAVAWVLPVAVVVVLLVVAQAAYSAAGAPGWLL